MNVNERGLRQNFMTQFLTQILWLLDHFLRTPLRPPNFGNRVHLVISSACGVMTLGVRQDFVNGKRSFNSDETAVPVVTRIAVRAPLTTGANFVYF